MIRRYGLLTSTEDHTVINGRRCTEVYCDCGSPSFYVLDHNLKRGSTNSCGCNRSKGISEAKIKDLSGMKFGKLTVVKFWLLKDSNAYFLAKCDCGSNTVVRGRSLSSGNTKSCGCARSDAARQHAESNSSFVRNHGRLKVGVAA